MPTSPNCANCGESYAHGHHWAGSGKGACKRPTQGTKTYYRAPAVQAPVTKGVAQMASHCHVGDCCDKVLAETEELCRVVGATFFSGDPGKTFAELTRRVRISAAPVDMLLSDLIHAFLDAADELRWRLSGAPNPALEHEDGSCRHAEDVGCSWRCTRRTKGNRAPTADEVREFIRSLVGVAGFCLLDGYGEDARSIEIAPLIEMLRAEVRLGAADAERDALRLRVVELEGIVSDMTKDAGLF